MFFKRFLFYAISLFLQLANYHEFNKVVPFVLINRLSYLTLIGNHLAIVLNIFGLLKALLGSEYDSKRTDFFFQINYAILVNVVANYWILYFFKPELLFREIDNPLPFHIDIWLHLGVFIYATADLVFVGGRRFSGYAVRGAVVFIISYSVYLQVLEHFFEITLYPISKGEYKDFFTFITALSCCLTAFSLFLYKKAFPKKQKKE